MTEEVYKNIKAALLNSIQKDEAAFEARQSALALCNTQAKQDAFRSKLIDERETNDGWNKIGDNPSKYSDADVKLHKLQNQLSAIISREKKRKNKASSTGTKDEKTVAQLLDEKAALQTRINAIDLKISAKLVEKAA